MSARARNAAEQIAADIAGQARDRLRVVLAEEEQEADPPDPLLETLPQFVEQIIAVLYAGEFRVGTAGRWCAQWWRHPEVVFRLEALWRANTCAAPPPQACRSSCATTPTPTWLGSCPPTAPSPYQR